MGTPKDQGLEGIVVAETRLSDVDGARGRLTLAGHDVEAIAGRLSFEEVCGVFWRGPDGTKLESDERLREQLADGRQRAFARLGDLGDALRQRDGMDALRASLAHLAPTKGGHGDRGDCVMLTSAAAVFAAAWARVQAGGAPIAPDPKLGHAADYLRMASGKAADEARARALDTYLVTVVDHGMSASTFAARVVASTASDMVSAIVAAVGALKGPLHGGAPGPVLDMLDAIGTPDHAAAWLNAELAAGRRIMGMGHRVYRVRDPRAAVLEKAVERLAAGGDARLALARAVERQAEEILHARHPDRALKANVEFFTAVLLEAVGLPRTAFTPTFTVGRVAGWCAHVMEQRRYGRLIRPTSRYIGESPAP